MNEDTNTQKSGRQFRIAAPEDLQEEARKTIAVMEEQKQVKALMTNDNDWTASLGNWKMKMRRKSTTKSLEEEEEQNEELTNKQSGKKFDNMIKTNRIRNMYPYGDEVENDQPKKKSVSEVVNKDEIPDWDGGFEKKEEKKVWKPKVPFQPSKPEEKKSPISTKYASPKSSVRNTFLRDNSPKASSDFTAVEDTLSRPSNKFSNTSAVKTEIPITPIKNNTFTEESPSSPKNGHKVLPITSRNRGNVSAKGKFFEEKSKEPSSSPPPVLPRSIETLPYRYSIEKQTSDDEPRLMRRGSPDSGIDGGANFGGSSTPGSVKTTDDYVDISEANMAELKRSKLNTSPKNGAGERLFHEKNIRINLNGITTKKFGFALRGGKEDNQPLHIGKVQMGSAADINELEEGDELVAVNNKPVTDRNRNSIEDLLSSIEKESTPSVTLTIRRSMSKDEMCAFSDSEEGSMVEHNISETEHQQEVAHLTSTDQIPRQDECRDSVKNPIAESDAIVEEDDIEEPPLPDTLPPEPDWSTMPRKLSNTSLEDLLPDAIIEEQPLSIKEEMLKKKSSFLGRPIDQLQEYAQLKTINSTADHDCVPSFDKSIIQSASIVDDLLRKRPEESIWPSPPSAPEKTPTETLYQHVDEEPLPFEEKPKFMFQEQKRSTLPRDFGSDRYSTWNDKKNRKESVGDEIEDMISHAQDAFGSERNRTFMEEISEQKKPASYPPISSMPENERHNEKQTKELKQAPSRRQFVDEDFARQPQSSQSNPPGYKTESIDFIPAKLSGKERKNENIDRNKQPKQLFPIRRSFEVQADKRKFSGPFRSEARHLQASSSDSQLSSKDTYPVRKEEDLREKVYKLKLQDEAKDQKFRIKRDIENIEKKESLQTFHDAPTSYSSLHEIPSKRYENKPFEQYQRPPISSAFSYSTSELSSLPKNIKAGHQVSRSVDLSLPSQRSSEDQYRRQSNASDYGQSLNSNFRLEAEKQPQKISNWSSSKPLPPSFRSYNPPSPTRSDGPPGVPCVSAQEKCQGCGDILGSGAAMLIESLGLHYHLTCFTCSVCREQLASGYDKGADVRVRGKKLHCQNCYSSEQGI